MLLALTAGLLAAAEPQASTAALWITGGFAASGGVSAVISIAAVFATRREVEALEKRVSQIAQDNHELRREIGDMERRLQASSEQRAKANHDRTNEILEAVSRLAGRFEQAQRRDLPR